MRLRPAILLALSLLGVLACTEAGPARPPAAPAMITQPPPAQILLPGATEAQSPAPPVIAPMPSSAVPQPEFPDRLSIEALDSMTHPYLLRHDGRGATIGLGTDGLFEPGSATLARASPWSLDEIASVLARQVGRRIHVRVYTDALGDRGQSIALSQRRADVLRDYFVARGVIPEQIVAEGMGPSRPIADNHSPSGRAVNRRLEILVEAPSRAGRDGP